MSNKIALLMFAVAVLLVSSTLVVIPQASALEKGNTMKNISTASFGNSLICGDHKCKPGEHSAWYNALWQSQRTKSGKVVPDTNGDVVMNKLAGPTGNSEYTWNTPVNQQTPIKGYK
jgi:hypothetical protein